MAASASCAKEKRLRQGKELHIILQARRGWDGTPPWVPQARALGPASTALVAQPGQSKEGPRQGSGSGSTWILCPINPGVRGGSAPQCSLAGRGEGAPACSTCPHWPPGQRPTRSPPQCHWPPTGFSIKLSAPPLPEHGRALLPSGAQQGRAGEQPGPVPACSAAWSPALPGHQLWEGAAPPLQPSKAGGGPPTPGKAHLGFNKRLPCPHAPSPAPSRDPQRNSSTVPP